MLNISVSHSFIIKNSTDPIKFLQFLSAYVDPFCIIETPFIFMWHFSYYFSPHKKKQNSFKKYHKAELFAWKTIFIKINLNFFTHFIRIQIQKFYTKRVNEFFALSLSTIEESMSISFNFWFSICFCVYFESKTSFYQWLLKLPKKYILRFLWNLHNSPAVPLSIFSCAQYKIFSKLSELFSLLLLFNS